MDEEQPPTNMQISFCMDIKTQGAREGLLISTGVFSAAVGNQNEAHSIGSFWPILPATYRIPSSKSIENIASGKASDSLANEKLESIDLDEFDANISQKDMPSRITNICENVEEDYQMNLRNNNSQEIQQSAAESAIRLNLFEGNHQQLVPLQQQRPPSRNGLLTQFDARNPPMRPQNPSPNPNSTTPPSTILRDSTTTTTTLEIFRPKVDSADFFQLPKGPLAFEKDPVLIVPAKGPVHERRESSETRFSGKIHQQMDPIGGMAQPQKSVQWGDSISIHPSPTPSSSSTAPSQVTVLQSPQQRQTPQNSLPLLFSPPQHSSTPIQTTNGLFPQMAQSQPIQSTTPTPPPIILSPQSPPPLLDDHLTIFRQQQQKHSERVHRIPPNVAECPPRPPKGRLYGANKRMGAAASAGGGENAIPPRPPKPEHLKKRTIRERSQSADPMESDETRNRQFGHQNAQQPQQQQRGGIGPVRSASSNEIFKLYQTRDCLGRVVCEW